MYVYGNAIVSMLVIKKVSVVWGECLGKVGGARRYREDVGVWEDVIC